MAVVLLATKFIATVCCYGLGGCGGIFSPTLFLGGMTGVAVAGLAGLGWHLARGDAIALGVVGMSACLGAVVFAPVTGILMVFEMTHEFALVPALMLGALVSQTIGRRLNHENFYDALLAQDGHRLEHVRPPRDLQSWRVMSVSAIANFSPKTLADLSPAALRNALASPYERFPVVQAGRLIGILTRSEAEAALIDSRVPRLASPVICRRDQTVAELQAILIDTGTNMVVVLDREGGQVIGLVTLHDLLRTEVTFAENSAGDS
jgi:CIC family chloride channel protein